MQMFALGPAGTNGHEAASEAFKILAQQESTEVSFTKTNEEILQNVLEKGGFGVVPIENSAQGLVSAVRDWWMNKPLNLKREEKFFDVSVVGEIHLPIRHQLLARSGIKAEDVTSVISHPQALGQCAKRLASLGLADSLVSEKSTALAAKKVSEEKGMETFAALASGLAGEIYNLDTCLSDMQDYSGNVTRFHVIGNTPIIHSTENDRTAVIFYLKNESGALADVLNVAKRLKINISSLHSIPLGRPQQFAFYCELDCHQFHGEGVDMMKGLRAMTSQLIVLGSYPQSELPI